MYMYMYMSMCMYMSMYNIYIYIYKRRYIHVHDVHMCIRNMYVYLHTNEQADMRVRTYKYDCGEPALGKVRLSTNPEQPKRMHT